MALLAMNIVTLTAQMKSNSEISDDVFADRMDLIGLGLEKMDPWTSHGFHIGLHC